MATARQTEISVITVFDGKQDGREIFIDLILKKYRDNLDFGSDKVYNNGKVFSDVRVQRAEVLGREKAL